ncbi:MAG: response regulator transcription factor [Gammaproteobacteria bacterium]|nr:response regulator transcription factor [Gammaproteobacteria bacterium]
MSQRVLVVEDEKDLADLLVINLNQAGYETEQAQEGDTGLALALSGQFDLIVLDVMLPKLDGMEICRQVRLQDQQTPIIMLTARDTETDRVMGLEIGADDYLTKPFGLRELMARVKALLRRSGINQEPETEKALIYPGFMVDPISHKVTVDEQELSLTSTEFDLLFFLARHPGQVFSRAQLLDSVWGYNHLGYEHTVNSHINRLRAKLEHGHRTSKYVHTIWGVGYKFEILT